MTALTQLRKYPDGVWRLDRRVQAEPPVEGLSIGMIQRCVARDCVTTHNRRPVTPGTAALTGGLCIKCWTRERRMQSSGELQPGQKLARIRGQEDPT